MLNKVSIKNFKCINKKDIELSDLTLLTGFNASGKTSTIQSLLIASQVLSQPQGLNSENHFIPINTSQLKIGAAIDLLTRNSISPIIEYTFSDSIDELNLCLEVTKNNKQELKVIRVSGSDKLCSTLQKITYISADRVSSKDLYNVPNHPSKYLYNVGAQGEFAAWLHDLYSDETISPEKKSQSQESDNFRVQVNAWMSELFPDTEVNTNIIPKTDLVSLEFKGGVRGEWEKPSNTGFGLSYIFPIIVAGLISQKGRILIIDSPEAHLHPKGQSVIGYFLCKVASAGTQVILETHSDHVLNGIRRAVSDNTISNTNVKINFFDNSKISASSEHDTDCINVTSILINEKGQLDFWPNGFFDQFDIDLERINKWG